MSMEQCLFSKLIEACEMEWIPDADTLYGEHLGTLKYPKELKQLISLSSAKDNVLQRDHRLPQRCKQPSQARKRTQY